MGLKRAEGNDLAGQQVQSLFNNRNSPFAVLQLANREAEIDISKDDIVIQEDFPTVGQEISVNITVHNYGQVDGITMLELKSSRMEMKGD